jgi:uncharacterized protein
MNEVIERELMAIAKQQAVRILYACEAGSRSYGMETSSSDYDIRLITMKPVRAYVSVAKPSLAWSHSAPPYEWHSWDIFKALELLRKSNPSLYEWFSTPIVYAKDDFFYMKMKEIISKHYSLRVLAHHYHALAIKNIHALTKKEMEPKAYVKTYVQALRGALMFRWIVRRHMLPPLPLTELVDGDASLCGLVERLKMAKQGEQMDVRLFAPETVAALLDVDTSAMERLPAGEPLDVRILDELVWTLLGI